MLGVKIYCCSTALKMPLVVPANNELSFEIKSDKTCLVVNPESMFCQLNPLSIDL